MKVLAAGLALVTGCLPLTACSLDLHQSGQSGLVKNQCGDDSDCAGGTCWSGMCVNHVGDISGLLLEVTPPTSTPAVGGVRFLKPVTPSNAFSVSLSNSDFKVHLEAVTSVNGYVLFDEPEIAACAPLQVTLIPLEQSYGLPSVSYVSQAAPPTAAIPDTCHPKPNTSAALFNTSVPPGKYDIYVESAPAPNGGADAGAAACGFVPRLFREVTASATTCLPASAPKPLQVKIQWPSGSAGIDSLEGWTVDIVHPTTGQLLSDRPKVSAAGSVDVHYSDVTVFGSPGSLEDAGQDLVRLTPPSSVTAPVIQFVRSGLEALSGPNYGITPPLGPFPAPVNVEGSVYKEAEFNANPSRAVPVPSVVSLIATKIVGITPGIFASYSTQISVGSDGKYAGQVLPGDYRVRVVPQAGLGLAAVETTLSWSCKQDPNAPGTCVTTGSGAPVNEAGKTLLVPKAASISGSVDVAFGGGQLSAATVEALPATFGKEACVESDGGVDAGGSDAGCAISKVGVLEISLGEGGFVPRAASAPVNGSSFRMTEVDCGGCGKGEPAFFDVSVRSQDGSAFPWLLRTGVPVESDVNLGQLELPLPIIQQGVVDILSGPTAEPITVAGALIRAYVLRNDRGEVVANPDGLKSCTSIGPGPQQPDVRCIRSVLQVAETRAANDGSFQLVLPSSIE